MNDFICADDICDISAEVFGNGVFFIDNAGVPMIEYFSAQAGSVHF
jgi:hypothetical protein